MSKLNKFNLFYRFGIRQGSFDAHGTTSTRSPWLSDRSLWTCWMLCELTLLATMLDAGCKFKLEKDPGPARYQDWSRLARPWPWSLPSRTMNRNSTWWSETAWLMMERELRFNWLIRKVAWPGPSWCPDSPRSRTLVPLPPCSPMLTSRPSNSLIPWKSTSNVPFRSAGW